LLYILYNTVHHTSLILPQLVEDVDVVILCDIGHHKYKSDCVGTLRIGYPRMQASSQDNSSRLRAAPRLPRVPAARAPALGSGQLQGHHVSPRLGFPLSARGSRDTTCPRGLGSPSRLGAAPGPPRVLELCGVHASKQISSGDPAIMISIGAGAPVSSKALRNKGCSARSQGMQQTAH
jgi:hypothetical protein